MGVFRSGTSLLYALLNQHPQIALMYECDVWDFPAVASRWRFAGNWLERQEFYNQALSRHRLTFGGSLNGLEHIRTPDDLYRCHGNSKPAQIWGEKSPVYAARLGRLARHYPQASFILIWRDPLEVYRSVLRAGQKNLFFRRPGMLHRLIYDHEKMLGESGRLQQAGARIHHIRYDQLVDETETVCRATCAFLGVPFEPQMLNLKQADFSAVYQTPNHEFLRRGIIERQNFSEDTVLPAEAAKLKRFACRWQRLSGQPLGIDLATDGPAEVSFAERWWHFGLGKFFFLHENFKRLAFEFLPMPWLRTYRLFKFWIAAPPESTGAATPVAQFRQHGITLLVSFLLWAGIVWLDKITGPEISFGPLYLIPCGILALVVGRGWASVAALLNAIAITALKMSNNQISHPDLWLTGVLIWNLFMRFVFFQIFVLLLDRIRLELVTRSSEPG